MKQILFISMFLALIPLVSIAEDAANWIERIEQMRMLRAELARQGAYAFVTNRTTTPPIAPHIHSQCWVDWLPRTNVEQIAFEQEKRDLGLDFIGNLEKLALTDVSLENIDSLENHADRMLTIAKWLKSEGGYGNHILKSWCEGIALSAMGGMAVNPRCDTNRVLRLLVSIDSVQVNISRRVSILNEESPHRYTVPKCTTYNEAAKSLELQIYPHLMETRNHYRKAGQNLLIFDKVNDHSHRYAFYLPDILLNHNDIIREWWQRKRHEEVCLYGLENNMVEEIRQILNFRSQLGDIPKPTDEETKDINLAFNYRSRLHDVWRKHTKGNEFHFLGADAIVKIYGRTFVNWFTRELQLKREADKRDKSRKGDK